MITSRRVNMVGHPRGSCIPVIPIAVSGVATLGNKVIHWSPSSISNKVGTRCQSPSYERFLEDAAHPSCDSPNTSRRFALGASNVCLVVENPTCPVPALWDARVIPLWSYDYGHAQTEYTPSPLAPPLWVLFYPFLQTYVYCLLLQISGIRYGVAVYPIIAARVYCSSCFLSFFLCCLLVIFWGYAFFRVR